MPEKITETANSSETKISFINLVPKYRYSYKKSFVDKVADLRNIVLSYKLFLN